MSLLRFIGLPFAQHECSMAMITPAMLPPYRGSADDMRLQIYKNFKYLSINVLKFYRFYIDFH